MHPVEDHGAPGSGGSRSAAGWLVLLALAGLAAFLLARPILTGPVAGLPAVAQSSSPYTVHRPAGGVRGGGIVNVDTELGYRGTLAAGTGIILDRDGLVLTNNHVIQGATALKATDTRTGRTFPAHVVGYDRSNDVAVIRLSGAKGAGLRPAAFGDSGKVSEGDAVTAKGNAGGKGGAPKIAQGRVTALEQTVIARDDSDGSSERLSGLIETDAAIRPGDSGGPLFNASGEVVGMDTAASAGFKMAKKGKGRGFAIPINRALGIAEQIRQGHGGAKIHIGRTAMLGVQVRPVDAGRTGSGGQSADGGQSGGQGGGQGGGAEVASTLPDTPADRLDVPTGAVITALDGEPVDSPNTLTDLLLRHHPGDRVALTYRMPGGQPVTQQITLASGPPQ
ncbi:PDZ domain-containing protein [Actinomadura logoneensis]|uniref:PDZ domain-containing protein n=1 Tax=Actinomadura logoneensis TaxID=2293572 RepID=A0A372JDR5_9ACTN|nr:trypsin-like peptidase domain-containing protein [Actinomadura logoneensis]RFU38110.1 PDZ domain-containing protein [Actinomadura logoneensis]